MLSPLEPALPWMWPKALVFTLWLSASSCLLARRSAKYSYLPSVFILERVMVPTRNLVFEFVFCFCFCFFCFFCFLFLLSCNWSSCFVLFFCLFFVFGCCFLLFFLLFFCFCFLFVCCCFIWFFGVVFFFTIME